VARVIFVNRYFYPDQSATSRVLTDLAFGLAAAGHSVHVITSRQLIEDASAGLEAQASINGVQVHRVWTTRFGRGKLKARAFDYLSFHWSARAKVAAIAGPGDVVVAKTDPPLLSISLEGVTRSRGARLVTWLQDLFPEVATALGVLDAQGFAAQKLTKWRDRSLRAAAMNVVLGEAMARVVRSHDVLPERVKIIPNWSDGARIGVRGEGARAMRQEWGLEDAFVVGYCGNLGRVHEFNTLLEMATQLSDDPRVHFVFVGSGAQAGPLMDGVKSRHLTRVHLFPAEPEERLSALLGAMDVHAVVLAPALEGFVVPSKLYGVLAAGRPVLNIGAQGAEISELVEEYRCGFGIVAGDATLGAQRVRELVSTVGLCEELGDNARQLFEARYDRNTAVEHWSSLLDEVSCDGR
jgi:colanic acid biosynthesis glycosyl transferase WcaI